MVIPAKCRDALLKELHESHPGISRMKSLARSHIWWPKMDADIELFARNCGMCQDSANMSQAITLHPWEWPGRPWFRVHMDYAGPIQGKWILVIANAHSKYIDAHVVSSPSSAVTERMLKCTFVTHGSPHVIVSDNASSFTSKEFSRFCALNGIKLIDVRHITPPRIDWLRMQCKPLRVCFKKLLGIWKRDYCVYWPDAVYSRNQQRVNHQQCY